MNIIKVIKSAAKMQEYSNRIIAKGKTIVFNAKAVSLGEHNRDQDKGTQQKPDAIKVKWGNILHAYSLGHKSGAPYQGSEEQKKIRF